MPIAHVHSKLRALSLVLTLLQASACRPGTPQALPSAASEAPGVATEAKPEGPAPACAADLPPVPTGSPFVLRYDQLGYGLEGERFAVLLGAGQPAPHYRLYALSTRCFVGEGVAGPRMLDAKSHAGEALTGDRLDLSALREPGEYLVVLEDGAELGPVRITRAPYAVALPLVLRFLSSQRCGPTTPELSGHGPCHLSASLTDSDARTRSGDGVGVADGFRGRVDEKSGPFVHAEGGWHDAGDYIKFMGTTSFLLSTALTALRDHPQALARLHGKATVEALERELRWGLAFLVGMLGGDVLYHQVSGPSDHDGDFRRPEADTATAMGRYLQRPVFRFSKGKGANILGRAAAALALGSAVFAADAAYAEELRTLAVRAYAAAKERPSVQNPVPNDYYPEESFRDDLTWGAAALLRLTGEPSYGVDVLAHARGLTVEPGTPHYWGSVDALALLEAALAFPEGSAERSELTRRIAAITAPIATSARTPRGAGALFAYALDHFGNGTIAESLGAASACLAARRLGLHADCVTVAHNQLHWLWGQNPFGLSFQIGVGERFPHAPHHALSSVTGAPLLGAIVGGPTSVDMIDEGIPAPTRAGPLARFSTDALFYEDVAGNWVVNEPAIDFVAPLLFVVAELSEAESVAVGSPR